MGGLCLGRFTKIVYAGLNRVCMHWSTATEEQRMRDGENFVALIWSEIMEKTIQKSVHVYGLTPEQGAALRRAFRRYQIIAV